jgi:arabinose-5-phosphate isomerase
MRVSDLFKQNEKPVVMPNASINEVILEISEKRLGVTAVIEDGNLLGVVTDGDLRRMLTKNPDLTQLKARDIMTLNPKTIDADAMAIEAVEVMKSTNISQLLVMQGNTYQGVVHFHDLLKEGLI